MPTLNNHMLRRAIALAEPGIPTSAVAEMNAQGEALRYIVAITAADVAGVQKALREAGLPPESMLVRKLDFE